MADRPAEPEAERPGIVAAYGIAAGTDGLLPWRWVDERLRAARNYWVATSRPDGRPHVVPVWGVWLERALYFSTSHASRKGRNLAANPALTVHLESGDEAVILEGRAEDIVDPARLVGADAAYAEKYVDPASGKGFRLLEGLPANAVFALRPSLVLAWTEPDFPNTATRWRFDRA